MYFQENFSRLFPGVDLAHCDTMHRAIAIINPDDLEEIKTQMIKLLIKNKVVKPILFGMYLIAIDATGITNYDEDIENSLLHKTPKGGKTKYHHMMLEAKLVTPGGLALSVASEPLTNTGKTAYEKQDCELKAFERLAKILKGFFPRLNICLVADGLYSNASFFKICKDNDWAFVTTFKDGCIPTLATDIYDKAEKERFRFERVLPFKQSDKTVHYETAYYQHVDGLIHKGHELTYVEAMMPINRGPAVAPLEVQGHPKVGVTLADKSTDTLIDDKVTFNEDSCEPTHIRFAYLTSIKVPSNKANQIKEMIIELLVKVGRTRWKIENEGFNTQKNHGYQLSHKFSRVSMNAMFVYYQILQIAHIIN